MKFKVLIADDSKVIRHSLSHVLQNEDDIEVVGCAQNGEDAIELASRLQPDVIIMDLLMPVMTGIAATKILTDKFKVPVKLNNDVKCFTLGEARFGIGRGYQNIIGLTFGTGIGGGIMINNQIATGKNNTAGEFELLLCTVILFWVP